VCANRQLDIVLTPIDSGHRNFKSGFRVCNSKEINLEMPSEVKTGAAQNYRSGKRMLEHKMQNIIFPLH